MKKYDKLFDEGFSFNLGEKDVEALKEYFKNKRGWVYIAKTKDNSFLKIGRTGKNPLERAKTLSSTGVLNSYEILFTLPFFNQFIGEKKVHSKLARFRVSKEFFSIKESVAIDIIQKEMMNEKKLLDNFIDTNLIAQDIELMSQALKKT